jgi:nucleoid DNA-binding protein
MELKERIFAAIGKEATPIYKIAESADVCTTTASKYCYILQAENKITISSFGNMKLVRRKEK